MKLTLVKKPGAVIFFALILLKGISGCSSQPAEDGLLVEEVLRSQKKLVQARSEDLFRLYQIFNSEKLADPAKSVRDQNHRKKANVFHGQFRNAMVAADSLIWYLEREKEPDLMETIVRNFSPDKRLQKLEANYSVTLAAIKANPDFKRWENRKAVMQLNNMIHINPEELSRQARLVDLRSQQLQLLNTEKLLLEDYSVRIGGDGITCYFNNLPYHILNTVILQKGQEGRIFIGPSAQWRPDNHFPGVIEPTGFKLNGKEQAVFLNSRFYLKDSLSTLRLINSPGFGAQILIPTTVADLGKADSVVKSYSVEWKVPVSYFRDSVITMNRNFIVRKKCQ